MIESSELTLDEFCRHSNSQRYSEANSGKYRDVVDALRTVYWFHGLRIRARANATYQIEKTFEPGAFRTDAYGGNYRLNKWNGYKIGLHTPKASLVDSINRKAEGTKDEFEHVLWETLRLSRPAAENVDEWIRRLSPDTQNILWAKKSSVTGGNRRIRKIHSKALKMIERRASLDALACLTMLLREAHETDQQQLSFQIGKSLCRVLLMLGEFLIGSGICRPLYDYYETSILPLSSWKGTYFSFKGVDFRALVGYLHDGLYHLEGVSLWRLTETEKMIYKLKLLNHAYGWDYMMLLNPIQVPSLEDGDYSNCDDHQNLVAMKNRRDSIFVAFRLYRDTQAIAQKLLESNSGLIDS